MGRGVNPFDLMKLGQDMAQMGFEASSIVAMRTMGMMGLWHIGKSEVYDMVAEKPAAFAEAWSAGLFAAMRGAAPQAVLAASLQPIGRKTRSNHRRLARTGIGFF